MVTGASAGVGRATARAFAERGFDVALLARGLPGSRQRPRRSKRRPEPWWFPPMWPA